MINSWFINNGNTKVTWDNASEWCANNGVQQPSRLQLTNGKGVRKAGGGLYAEWGPMGNYGSSGFINFNYWTSEGDGSGHHYFVGLDDGITGIVSPYNYYGVCRQSF
ncbi:hypothetical protein UA45_19120 [Morganella morganii]|uniref:Invasin n=1 Tax=Morganella morganii TaxID=582 RepID=A0A0D8L680_MORMO|nr:hypothetical protein UA45_19120 [Morganella morganii]